MKKFCLLVAITLVISMAILLPNAEASVGTCLRCGSNETYYYEITTEEGPTGEYCRITRIDRKLVCADCNYMQDVQDPPLKAILHSFSYQDLGCSNNVHTWKKYCTKCSWYDIFRIQCPGPPHCVYPW